MIAQCPGPPAKIKALSVLAESPRKTKTKPFPLWDIPHGDKSQPQISRELLQPPPPIPAPQMRHGSQIPEPPETRDGKVISVTKYEVAFRILTAVS